MCDSYHAAELLGVKYPRYMEFKRDARELKPYHLASIKAHTLLSRKALLERKKESCSATG